MLPKEVKEYASKKRKKEFWIKRVNTEVEPAIKVSCLI